MDNLSNEEPGNQISDETVVLNTPVFTLDSFSGDVLKETYATDSQNNDLQGLPVANVAVGANLIQRPDGSVILDTTGGFTTAGGLILSVTEGQANHLTHLVNNSGEVHLNTIQGQPLTATAQLIPSSEGLVVSQSSPSVAQLFHVSDDGLSTGTHQITDNSVRHDIQIEPQRKKGGWPKGKRRKPERESNVPKSPATAYVIFAISRRQQLKKEQPHVTFVQATKLMGTEWSNMSSREKEKYMKEAENDKKRYIEELREYQNSEAYVSFQRRKKQRMNAVLEDGDNSGDGNFLDDLEEEGLYCSLCDQYFSSLHNRKEHMFGKQHLQNMTSEFEKDVRETSENANSESSDSAELSRTDGPSEEGDHGNLGFNMTLSQPEAHGQLGALIQSFMQTFIMKNAEREMEAMSLARTLDANREAHANLVNRIQVYKEIILKLELQLGNIKAYGAALATQIDTLRMVPMLFGVVNKWAM